MKLKNLICVLLALLMVCGAAFAETTINDVIDDYEGTWVSDRLTLVIESLDDVVYATVYWPDSATEIAQWDYDHLTYDEVADELNTLETGVMTYSTYEENGDLISSEERYSDGAAAFKLTEDGNLVWTNYKETPGENEIVFERSNFSLTLGDFLDLEDVEGVMSNYSPETYVYAYILDGTPIRVTAEMTQEIYDALWNLEFDDNYDQNFHDLIADLPVTDVEDLSYMALSQEELDAFVGMKGEDVLAQGFSLNGYMYSDDETVFYLENGLFDYAFEFEEIIDDEADPYEQVNGMTVKGVRLDAMAYEVVSTSDDTSSWDFDMFSWLFGDLYSSVPRPTASPEWVTNLPQAQDENTTQLFIVAGIGMDKTTATISMHQRDEDGAWQQVLSTPGFVGRNGLCMDADHVEGCGQTPIGVYRFNKAFGIADDPACSIPYIQVDSDIYWSGDDNVCYNEMVNINDYPELDMTASEHIIDYDYQYQYCLNISFNEDGTPGKGSAIFLHCFGPAKPYTGGCVAIPENVMRLVMQTVTEDCVVVIDTLENMGGSF